MGDEVDQPDRSRTSAPRRGRFRRHEIGLADGGRLILHGDGTIDRVDEDGVATRSWAPDDPDWPDQAIRFGLHAQTPTVTPQGRRVQGTRPPRG